MADKLLVNCQHYFHSHDHHDYFLTAAQACVRMRVVWGYSPSAGKSAHSNHTVLSHQENNTAFKPPFVLKCPLSCSLDEESQYRGLDPLLLLESGRRLEQARWHPTNDNLFAAVAASDRSVHMYDAQYTQVCPDTQLCAIRLD